MSQLNGANIKRNNTVHYRMPVKPNHSLVGHSNIRNKKRSYSVPDNIMNHPGAKPSFASDAVNYQKSFTVDEMISANLSKVLIIYTGGTIGMKNTELGYVPAKGYLAEFLETQQRFHDSEYFWKEMSRHSPHETDPRVGCLVCKKWEGRTTFQGSVYIPVEFSSPPASPHSAPNSPGTTTPVESSSPPLQEPGDSSSHPPLLPHPLKINRKLNEVVSPAENTPISLYHKLYADSSPLEPHSGLCVSVLSPFLITPPSIYNKRTLYTIVEFEPLCDSSNMDMSDWAKIASFVEANYQAFDSFIVLHGTDTMTYSTSALSFMLENLGKSVIFTGSQIPITEVRNDAVENLLGALTIAGHFIIPEVTLYFNNKLLRGNRALKKDAVELDAFESPNMKPLVNVGINIEVSWQDIQKPRSLSKFKAHKVLESNVAVVRLFPGITASTIRAFLSEPIKGVVLETFGAGNAPHNKVDILKAISDATKRGVVIVNCSQCYRGYVSAIYETGKVLLEAGVVPGSDMTAVCALTKLSYLLGRGYQQKQIEAMMKEDLHGELTPLFSRPFSYRPVHIIEKVISALGEPQKKNRGSSLNQPTTKDDGGVSLNSNELSYLERSFYPLLLCSAAGNDDTDALKMLQEGMGYMSINSRDYDRRTALHVAASQGHVKAVKYLLEGGASVHVRDHYGHSPLWEAIRSYQMEVVKVLRSTGSYLSASDVGDLTPKVLQAVALGNATFIRLCIAAGVDMTVTLFDQRTPLHVAATEGHTEIVKLLLSVLPFTLLSNEDANNRTPLQCAQQRGHDEIATLIKQALK